jgi:hypothetical protein
MKRKIALTIAVAVLYILATPIAATAATTKVGNGDDGSDLEGFSPITSGPIFESRAKAVAQLKKLNVQGIPGLGTLLPEVEKAELFMAKRDISANLNEDQGTFHTTFDGLVFARTFPEPHAPTRFFPTAKSLSEEQLIALHIHEGLHRSLPATIRENENKVAQLTLAMTSPGANHDTVRNFAAKQMPENRSQTHSTTASTDNDYFDSQVAGGVSELYPIPDHARVKRPSILGYTYQSFTQNHETDTQPVTVMQTLQSFLYPFGSDQNPVGIGIEVSMLKYRDESQLGPLGLSLRTRLWSVRGFDIGGWATYSLNTLSSDELKNSPYGRDVLSAGISIRRDIKNFYVENVIGVTSSGSVEQKLAQSKITYKYGSVVSASVKAGARLGHFTAGGYGELLLSDNYQITAPNFEDSSGRYQIVGAGPDIAYEQDWWSLRIFGRQVVSSTKNANFTTLGNIMGKGSGQGSIGAQVSVIF